MALIDFNEELDKRSNAEFNREARDWFLSKIRENGFNPSSLICYDYSSFDDNVQGWKEVTFSVRPSLYHPIPNMVGKCRLTVLVSKQTMSASCISTKDGQPNFFGVVDLLRSARCWKKEIGI